METKSVPKDVPYPNTTTLPADVEAILHLGGGMLLGEPLEMADGSYVLPLGKDVKLERLPALNPKLPGFVSGSETVIEPDSFVDYITKFKSKDAIVLASLSRNTLVALLDYHGDARSGEANNAVPGRNAHRVTLNCPWDPDYKKWRDVFDKPIAQPDLMEFLEDLIHTIGEPLAGDLLDAVGNVEIDRDSKFKSVRNLRNGTVQFIYAEEERPGDLVVAMPDVIKVITPIFQGGTAMQLDVKLRYHLDKGILFFKLVLPGREKLERDGFRTIGERVRNETSTPVFYGA
jgi:hypothetical protein